jgi:hypothetical protein
MRNHRNLMLILAGSMNACMVCVPIIWSRITDVIVNKNIYTQDELQTRKYGPAMCMIA